MKVHIHDILANFFTMKILDSHGSKGYYFKDTSVSTDCFGMYMEDHKLMGGSQVYQLSYHSTNDDRSFNNTHVFTFYIVINETPGSIRGKVTMGDDYKLSDETCMLFFNLNLNICYAIERNFSDFVYYDRTVIERRYAIKNIIEHQ